MEFNSSQETIISDIKGLSKDSIKKLSEAFIKIEDELENGCSRQLIINALVSIDAITDEQNKQFIDSSPYRSEVSIMKIYR